MNYVMLYHASSRVSSLITSQFSWLRRSRTVPMHTRSVCCRTENWRSAALLQCKRIWCKSAVNSCLTGRYWSDMARVERNLIPTKQVVYHDLHWCVLLGVQIFPPVCVYPVLTLGILASVTARVVSSNAGAACIAEPVALLRRTT